MNTVIVNKTVTATAPGLASQTFKSGDEIAPWSPFYWPLIWGGHAVDSGHEDASAAEQVFRPDEVVASSTDPQIAPPGIWVQDLGNGNWTMWFAVED